MKHLTLLFLILLTTFGAHAQSTLQQESFETNGEGVRYTSTTFDRRTESPTPFLSQYFVREDNPVQSSTGSQTFGTNASPTTISNVNGTFFWASEGATGQTNTTHDRAAPTVTLNSVSITGYTNIQVKVAFADARGAGATLAAVQWENDDYVRVKVRIDGGIWQTIGQFVGDNPGGSTAGNLRQDLNLNNQSYDNVSAPVVTATLTDFTFNVTSSGTSMEVRVEVDQNGGTEELAFDNIRVTGTLSATSPPVLATIENTNLTYTEGDPATIITSTLKVSDPDNVNLTGATISLTTGLVTTQDMLLFINQSGISGLYNSTSGVLTLSGTASLASYQAALRSVKYQNTETVNATGGTRLVSFVVSDGTNTSNSVSRSIDFIAQLNAPAALPYIEDFESNGEGTRYASNAWSSTSPCLGFVRTNLNPYGCTPNTFGNISNSYYWYTEGTSNATNPNTIDIGTFVLAPVNATNTGNLHFNVRLATGQSLQWESDDYIKFFYRVNNGSWVSFGAFFGNGTLNTPGELVRDANLDGVADADGTTLTSTMQNIDFSLPAAVTGASVDFMIEVNSDGQEELAFDRIQVSGTLNNPPTIANQTRSVAENSPNGTNVGTAITASDPDAGSTLTYSITAGNTNGTFGINSSTGQITVANSAALNYEATPTYALTVQVTDNGSPATSASATVTVNVTNVNELVATITSQTNVSCFGDASGSATVTASGEAGPFTYDWTPGNPSGDGSTTVSSLTAQTYSVLVTATATGYTATTNVTITQPSAAITLNGSQSNVTTPNGSDGTATVTPSGGTPGYTYDWTPGTPTGDGTNAVTGLTAGNWQVTVTDTKGCIATKSFTIAEAVSSLTDHFRTSKSGNWNEVTTWQSSSDGSTWMAATLAPDFNANTITIQNNHTVTVTANLTTDQTTINAGGALVVDPNIVLIANDGTGTDITVDGTMTIKSTATGTGIVGNSAGSISGNVTVERFISSAGNRAFRLLTPSVNTTTFIKENWQENGINSNGFGTHITGSSSGANGFDITSTGQGSLFNYDDAAPAWIPAPNTDATTLNAKKGYLLHIRGDRTIDLTSTASPLPSSNATLRASGALLMGTQTFTGLQGNSKFSLIGNPYAAPINWASVYAASTGLTQFYNYWDPNIGTQGGFVAVKTDGTKSVTSNAGLNIQSGQAFFVQASGVAIPVVNIAENHKTTTNNNDPFRTGTQTEQFSSALYFRDEYNQRRLADGVLNAYNNNYSKGIDGDDAVQIQNWDEDIAISNGNYLLSIEARPLIDNADTIAFTFAHLKQKTYEFQFDVVNFNSPGLQATLVDNYLNTRTLISLSQTTVIPFTVTANAASAAPDRFKVIFSLMQVLPVNLTSLKASGKGTGVAIEWTVETESNMDRYEVEQSVNGQQFSKIATAQSQGNSTSAKLYYAFHANPNLGNNYYRIRSVNKSGGVQYSAIVKVNTGKSNNQITLYPNPVIGNTINVQFENIKKGKYSISFFNNQGQQVMIRSIQHEGGTASQIIGLNKMASGVYEVRITNNGKITTQKLIKN